MANPKVYILFLEFMDRHQNEGLRLLNGMVEHLFPGYTKKFLVIDNAIAEDIEYEMDPHTDLIGGDNSEREFSGWEKGLKWVKITHNPDPDAVFVLANDTFHRSYGQDYLKLFYRERIEAVLNENMLVGYADAYPQEVELFGLALQRWIRTSLFILNLRTLDRLLPLPIPYSDEVIFSHNWKEFFRDSAPLSRNYQQFLRTWLFGETFADSPFKETWHSQGPLTKESVPRFKAKARSILSEHYLSARARRLGIPLYDVPKGARARRLGIPLLGIPLYDVPKGDRRPPAEYAQRIDQEIKAYRDVENVHDLPPIQHYWSKKYLKPKMDSLNIVSIDDFYLDCIVAACRDKPNGLARVVSIGSGNCDLEVRLARLALGKDVRNFRIDCLDLNPHMLERGRELARSANVGDYMDFIEADVNEWQVKGSYGVCIANQFLHHINDLETLFAKIGRAIHPHGVFLSSDMIGRNGHMRWPEALEVINEIWREMPDRYKYNHQLKRFEGEYDNWDCSKEGFEGIRAQDILPLLMKTFHFETFLTFGNLIDVFVDRGFGPNFDVDNDEDKTFIDRVARLDDEMIDKGLIKPTHMIAAMRTVPVDAVKVYKHWTPEFCVRPPDVPTLRVASRATHFTKSALNMVGQRGGAAREGSGDPQNRRTRRCATGDREWSSGEPPLK